MDLAMAECGLQRSSVQASGSIKCVSGAELILQLSCRKLECQAQSDECLSRRGLASGGGGGGGAIVKRYSDHERKPRGRLMRQATVETTESRRRVLSEGRHRHWRSCEVDETRMDAGRRPTGSCEPSASVASPACASLAHSQCETIRSTNSQRPSFLDLTACPSPSSASVGEPGRRYPSAAPVCSQSAGLPQVVSVATGVAVGTVCATRKSAVSCRAERGSSSSSPPCCCCSCASSWLALRCVWRRLLTKWVSSTTQGRCIN